MSATVSPAHASDVMSERSPVLDLVMVGGAALVAASAAWVGAQAGLKGVIAGVGAFALVVLLIVARERQNLLLFGLLLSLVVLLHKSFGPSWDEVSSGPISIYVTTFDLMVGVLFVLWAVRSGFLRELWAVLQRPVVWSLVAGALLSSVSLLVAGAVPLALAEMVRMGVMFALFLVIAASLRRSAAVWTVLAGLAAFAVIQLVVVVLQWRTGGVLGLDFLGVPTELGERTLDSGQLGRPFGTVIHPVFLGAVLGTIATMALGLALFLRRPWQRLTALAVVPICLLPMLIAHIRAAMAAFLLTAVAMTAVALYRRRLRLRTVAGVLLVGALIAIPFTPSLVGQFRDNFLTDHFSLEVQSRTELNEVGVAMFLDHPLVGAGLNNFEQDMGPYQEHGLIFADNPVHNLFLLQAAETGLVGLLGMGVVAFALLAVAWRTSQVSNDLYAAVGFGFVGVLLFFLLEEQLGFSLRQDVPRSVFWLLAGLVVACSRLATVQQEPRSGPPRWLVGLRDWYTAPARRAAARPAMAPSGAAMATNAPPRRATRRVLRRRAAGRARRSPLLALRLRGRALRMAGLRGIRRGVGRHPRGIRGALATVVVLTLMSVPLQAVGGPLPPELQIVFTARDRTTGQQGIYTANGDGSNVRQVTPGSTGDHAWAAWAYGGSHIVYTIRTGNPGAPEAVYLMTADGRDRVQLTTNPWRNGQPKVSPDGRTVVFTSVWNEFPDAALYELDLATLQVSNLSSRNRTAGASEADPLYTADGRIVFANSFDEATGGVVPTQVWVMDPDGSNRQRLTHDGYYNVDPSMSPDGQSVAWSSYRGPGHPSKGDPNDPFSAKLHDWVLSVRHLASGVERVLVHGATCYDRMPDEACGPTEGPAYVPKYAPDGRSIGFVGIRSVNQVCICTVDAATGEGTVVVEDPNLAINWFDWIVPGPAPAFTPDMIGSAAPADALLFGGTSGGATPSMQISGSDRWSSLAVPLNDGLAPTAAAWSPDRTQVAFVARTPFDPGDAPIHSRNANRREHFTLDDLQFTHDPPVLDPATAEEQVFLRDLRTGETRQLTTPWTEDPLDGIQAGDARGNVDPAFSPDGRTLLVTNVSATTGESFILRIDLVTGEVVNLTSVTSGAVPVSDASASYSPDGSRIAFVSVEGADNDVYVMDANGSNVRRVTNDVHLDTSPVWTADGQRLVFTSYRGGSRFFMTDETATADAIAQSVPFSGWALVEADVATGTQRLVVPPEGPPVFRPRMSPDGTRVAGITVSAPGQPDVAMVDLATGTVDRAQVTMRTLEHFVEWR